MTSLLVLTCVVVLPLLSLLVDLVLLDAARTRRRITAITQQGDSNPDPPTQPAGTGAQGDLSWRWPAPKEPPAAPQVRPQTPHCLRSHADDQDGPNPRLGTPAVTPGASGPARSRSIPAGQEADGQVERRTPWPPAGPTIRPGLVLSPAPGPGRQHRLRAALLPRRRPPHAPPSGPSPSPRVAPPPPLPRVPTGLDLRQRVSWVTTKLTKLDVFA